jgi:hypothetical protein
MRRCVAFVGAIVLLLATVSPVAATSPYRIYLGGDAFDFPASLCGFTVHADYLANREYAKVVELEDGTTILTIRGSVFLKLSNPATHESIVVNAGGPGTMTLYPDGSSRGDLTGRSLLFASNLTSFGLPSNLVAVAGPNHGTMAADSTAFSGLTGQLEVITDVCAALAP